MTFAYVSQIPLRNQEGHHMPSEDLRSPAGALPFAVKNPKAYPRSFVQHELSCRIRDTKTLNPFGNTLSPWQLRFLTLGHLLESKGLRR